MMSSVVRINSYSYLFPSWHASTIKLWKLHSAMFVKSFNTTLIIRFCCISVCYTLWSSITHWWKIKCMNYYKIVWSVCFYLSAIWTVLPINTIIPPVSGVIQGIDKLYSVKFFSIRSLSEPYYVSPHKKDF